MKAQNKKDQLFWLISLATKIFMSVVQKDNWPKYTSQSQVHVSSCLGETGCNLQIAAGQYI